MRDLLVYAARHAPFDRHVDYAAQLTSLLGASLTGLYVAQPYIPLPAPSGVAVAPELLAYNERNLEQARAAAGGFKAIMQKYGVRHSNWQVAEGPLADTLAFAGHWHDLLLLPCHIDDFWASPGLTGQILLSTGMPCLVVPYAHQAAPRLSQIAFAWNESAEAIRALHAALPLLQRAERLVVLRGKARERLSAITLKPHFDLDAYLQRHGIRFEYQVLEGADDRAGEALLTAAKDMRADLLVMGAYGRSRFSEWIMGGTTRYALQHSDIPLLMRH